MKLSSRKVLVTSVIGLSSVAILVGFATYTKRNAPELSTITKYPELSYKASSPRGSAAGVVIPASCESNYNHVLRGPYYVLNGTGTNVPNAGRVIPDRAIRLNNGGCIWTNRDEFISRDPSNNQNFWTERAPVSGITRWTTGSFNGH